MRRKLGLLILFLLISVYANAGFFSKKKKLTYTPVTNLSLDEAMAVAKCYLDKHGLLIYKFSYGKGELISSYLPFYDLLMEKRARIKFYYKDNLLNVELVNMQQKNEDGIWVENDTCLTKKPKKIKAKIANELQSIANDPDKVNKCKKEFFSDVNVNFLFLQNATEVAGKRWFDNFMKNKEFSVSLSFRDLKENKGSNFKQYKYKLVGWYNPKSSIFSKEKEQSGNKVIVYFYTNSDKYVMASKEDKIQIKGKCVKFRYNKINDYLALTFVE